MDPTDHIADLEREVVSLRNRVAELEGELHQAREELKAAHERKVEEVSIPLVSIIQSLAFMLAHISSMIDCVI